MECATLGGTVYGETIDMSTGVCKNTVQHHTLLVLVHHRRSVNCVKDKVGFALSVQKL